MAACAANDRALDDEGRERRPAPIEARSDEFRYFIVTRPDFRKCAYPFCGGVYVAELNQATSSCFTGGSAPVEEADCYVAAIDLSILGLDAQVMADVENQAENGHVVLRGNLVAHSEKFPKLGKLEVEAAWLGQTLNAPLGQAGHFSHVADGGITCITHPCFSLNEMVLNTETSHLLSGLDLASSGASQAAIDAANAQLVTGGVMVAGNHATTTGPAGEGLTLVATEFYMPVKNPAAGEACGKNVCGPGTYCCNASCGMCAPEGGACIQIACEPEPACAHSECTAGDALEASCSSCAEAVCGADPYCCDTAWDAICVQASESLCGNVCAAPPAACVHSECGVGGKLDASCSPCAAAVCGADPFCCATAWDAVCVDEAEQLCGSTCAAPPPVCAHDECAVGDKLEAQCSTCATNVCQQDPYCCDVAWDAICTQQAQAVCGC